MRLNVARIPARDRRFQEIDRWIAQTRDAEAVEAGLPSRMVGVDPERLAQFLLCPQVGFHQVVWWSVMAGILMMSPGYVQRLSSSEWSFSMWLPMIPLLMIWFIRSGKTSAVGNTGRLAALVFLASTGALSPSSLLRTDARLAQRQRSGAWEWTAARRVRRVLTAALERDGVASLTAEERTLLVKTAARGMGEPASPERDAFLVAALVALTEVRAPGADRISRQIATREVGRVAEVAEECERVLRVGAGRG